jgi:hypothetical protein
MAQFAFEAIHMCVSRCLVGRSLLLHFQARFVIRCIVTFGSLVCLGALGDDIVEHMVRKPVSTGVCLVGLTRVRSIWA